MTPRARYSERRRSRRERQKKAAELTPESSRRTERLLVEIRENAGFSRRSRTVSEDCARASARLVTGSGFAVGTRVLPRRLGRREGRCSAPPRKFSTQRLSVVRCRARRCPSWQQSCVSELHATHRTSRRWPYYGPGPDSQKTGRSNYRLEDTNFSFRTRCSAAPPFRLGVTGGFTESERGPRNRRSVAFPTDRSVLAIRTPGIDHQTDYPAGRRLRAVSTTGTSRVARVRAATTLANSLTTKTSISSATLSAGWT